ncbi:TPA: prepilin peptidase, partial [Burkholderia cenocepacia]
MVLAWPQDPVAVVYAVSTVALVVLAAIDIDVFRLPDVITKPMALALVVALLAVALLTGDTDPWVRALLAGAGLGFCYLVLVFIGGGAGMGLGDAKLALSLGMLLGYQSWSHVVLGSMASFLLAGIAAI